MLLLLTYVSRAVAICSLQDTCEFLVAELPDGQLDLQDSYVIDEVSRIQSCAW